MRAYTRTSAKTPLAEDFATSLELFRAKTGRRPSVAILSSEDAGAVQIPRNLTATTTARPSGIWLLGDEGDVNP